ncbi:MAG: hypothetical protein JEZ06_21080, partial [Anaerolineaceae bacterium]|nr:hypothetical protein [Anaerolineaceae bacterium]
MSKQRKYTIFLIIISNLINSILAFTGNIATNYLPESMEKYVWLAVPIFSVGLFISIIIGINQEKINDRLEEQEPISNLVEDDDLFTEDLTGVPNQNSFYGRTFELEKMGKWISE